MTQLKQWPLKDPDHLETREWLEAMQSILELHGPERGHLILTRLLEELEQHSDHALPPRTSYTNNLKSASYPFSAAEEDLAKQAEHIIRWNAIAMVVQAGKYAPELGGHIATFASICQIYEVGFNHFFHGKNPSHPGDLIFFQGHASPGNYARAYLEGRLDISLLKRFRQEISTAGLSSYPHPWLMPDFWQFPTVSMGLGAMQAIYQARFSRYLENRQLMPVSNRKVWVFCGDGEMDEPESQGALTVASREGLDNLIMVINCNLQSLDGPVRGNGKIVEEMESLFRGAGWHIVKALWNSAWDPLFAQDHNGRLAARLGEMLDGDFQQMYRQNGAFIREKIFNGDPELKQRVAHWTDQDLEKLGLAGHDNQKIYAAYKQATENKGAPTLILIKSIKGFAMGPVGHAANTTHQQKKLTGEQLAAIAKHFNLPINTADAEKAMFISADSVPEICAFIKKQRKKLGGYLPLRSFKKQSFKIPDLNIFSSITEASGERELSTTMAFVRCLSMILRDKTLGPRVVPIIPDECRTFGMEGLFRQIGIYNPQGQLYEPVDRQQVMYYKESKSGQLIKEGITEGGAFSYWMAAATSYANQDLPMIPFYIFYSMFGFQRTGDFAWAAGDIRARGFILGATAGRTTLAGEGLQHQDGQSQLLSSLIPNCVSYDPCYAHELAVIIRHGLVRMTEKEEDIFFYITLMNENYSHPGLQKNTEEGIVKGMYLLEKTLDQAKVRIKLLGSGTILNEVRKAAASLAEHFQIGADIFSVTSFSELRREALSVERRKYSNPKSKDQPYVTQCLSESATPVLAATDYVRLQAEQIAAFVPNRYHVLGTDGYGRSGTRAQLRHFFEVDENYIAYHAIWLLQQEGHCDEDLLEKAAKHYDIDPNKQDPVTL
jgi:pyruvate dehydrogenase E1 component